MNANPIKIIEVKNKWEKNGLKNELKTHWTRLENTPGVFRYKLNVQKKKVLPGGCKFVAQLNSERTTLRRKPQPIKSVTPAFDENAFHFNKVRNEEILFKYKYPDVKGTITCVINVSPLTKYHTLICPDMESYLPQILTANAAIAAIELLCDFNDRHYRIGYNSPGAMASVNHLHMHLLYIEERLFVDSLIGTKHLIGDVHKFTGPIKAYCLTVVDWSSRMIKEIVGQVMKIVDFFCSENIPHNLFFTFESTEERQAVHIYIFPRNQVCEIKEFSSYNIACCELAGFVSVGNEDIYDGLSEESILEKIKNEIGEIPNLDEKICALFVK